MTEVPHCWRHLTANPALPSKPVEYLVTDGDDIRMHYHRSEVHAQRAKISTSADIGIYADERIYENVSLQRRIC